MSDEKYYNDFTLDELHLIRNNLSCKDCPVINQQLLELNRKIECMITHYCDHDLPKESAMILHALNAVKCNQDIYDALSRLSLNNIKILELMISQILELKEGCEYAEIKSLELLSI
jgi:hypothetical protein